MKLALQCLFLFLASVLETETRAEAGAPQWQQENGYSWISLAVPTGGKTGFKLLPPGETGINFTNTLDLRAGEANRVLFNGSGVAVGDFNGDGLPDLYFCSLNGHNALYQNLGGMRFKDVTQQSGIVCSNQFCRGAVFADINGDGLVDLLVATTGNGVLCFLNEGHGKFSDATAAAGTATRYGSVTLALADVDGNGTLDLYVANNRTDDIRDKGEVDLQMVNGKLTVPPSLRDRLVVVNGKVFEYGEPDILYLNDGRGHFSGVSWTNGAFLDEDGKALTGRPLDWGLTASFRDINGDGYPDLYVCNDYWTPDRIWLNDGHGHFRAAQKSAFRETSASSMGIDFADLNRSGNLDIFVVDMLSRSQQLRKRQSFAQTPVASPVGAIDNRPQVMRNTLLQNRGDGTFAEIANYAGLAASDWSWSPLFLDVDLDGYEDVLIAAGHTKDVQDLDAQGQIRARRQLRNKISQIADPKAREEAFIQGKIENSRLYPALDQPIVAFHNLKNYQFEETTADWGTAQLGVHHAMALADLDGDGDLDLIVNNLGSAAGIYRNESSAARVSVKLKGLAPNTQGIGAKVKLSGATVPMQSQEVVSGGRYMAGSDPELVFAARQATGAMTLEVIWRNGKRSTVKEVRANRLYQIDESASQSFATAPKLEPKPLFEDLSPTLGHTHHENEFNDFERQHGLPRKPSQSGPGVAWADVDGDGWDDLVIGSGKGGSLAIFHNDTRGGFQLTHDSRFADSPQDQTGIVFWRDSEKSSHILVGSANYEDENSMPNLLHQYDFEPGKSGGEHTLTNQDASIGPLALTDMDGDGELDLFVGGRLISGRYPEAASSKIYRRCKSGWELDRENSSVLKNVGLVSGAVWSDLDGDGYPELILACEWGPIRVFQNDRGHLSETNFAVSSLASPALTSQVSTLSQLTGWWNGVTTADLNGDGRLDIIACNWGLNSPYHASFEHPLLLYYGDFSGGGGVELIEAEFDPELKAVVPRRMRDKVAESIPEILGRFSSHKQFASASIAEVLGSHESAARVASVNTLASMLFLNRGNHAFAAQPLPREAQLAPAFSASVADFDGDGYEDIFLSQNFFANQPEIPRHDGGRGLLLRGDGKGTLAAVPGQDSGIKVYGEQRGAAVADFDHDGRPDLVVTQNGAATKLFRNVSGQAGLRVRLVGPPGNPDGIGAQVRLIFGEQAGAVREIHAGSGYLSQDSNVVVLSTPQNASAIWVRWPGGKVNTSSLGGKAGEISVNFDGKLQIIR
jgi:enediyne biosynthesis protein E4